jgi:hypothetical protein
MTHAHRRPHRYAPPRVTVLTTLAAGAVAVGVTVGLVLAAGDADAARVVPAVRYCDDTGGVMRCTDRAPLWPVGQTLADQAAVERASAAELGAVVGLAVAPDAVLVAP